MARSVVHATPSGIRELDAGNEGLCFLLERLFDPMVECRRRHGHCDHSACTKIGAVRKFLGRHFSRHEFLMEQGGYPGSTPHALEHARLLAELEAMQAAKVCGDRDRLLVQRMLSRWTQHHVTASDRPFGDWASRQGGAER